MAYISPTVTASGATFAVSKAAGLAGHLELLIAAQAATAAPTVKAAWTENGGGSSGGALAAGTYYQVITESNGFGETTAGPQGDQITVTATHIPRITFQTLKAGNTSRNVYIGLPGGSTGGPYKLYARGITAATYDLAAAAPTTSFAVAPPTANSTGLTYTMSSGIVQNEALSMLRAAKKGELQATYRYLSGVVSEFYRGEPVTFDGTMIKFKHAHATFALLAALCAEIGVLLDANPGTIASVATGIGARRNKRTWP